MSDEKMTRPEFDAGLNEDTLQGLQKDQLRYASLANLANKYGRGDIASILETVRAHIGTAIVAAEALGIPKPKESN